MLGLAYIRHIFAAVCSLALLLVGCASVERSAPAAAVPSALPSAAAFLSEAPPAAPTAAPPPVLERTATSAAAAEETVAQTAVPPTATPHPLRAYTIEGMRARDYPGGRIELGDLLEENAVFRRYLMAYPSDGLRITGTVNIPSGAGPFPVIILLHGWFERDQYWSGADTWQMADFFARNGYLVLAPDYRSWGGSDSGESFFHMGLVADTINLISSLPSLPQADAGRVALLGHSMGGGIATKVLVIDDRVAAAVLYAPNSADDADLIARWGPGCLPGQSEAAGDLCNPAEVIPAESAAVVGQAYLAAAGDPAFIDRVAPINFLDAVTEPVQIHIGTADGAALTQTPPQWSQKLHKGLQAAGKEVEFFSYQGQGHYFQPPAWGQMIERALALFDRELKS